MITQKDLLNKIIDYLISQDIEFFTYSYYTKDQYHIIDTDDLKIRIYSKYIIIGITANIYFKRTLNYFNIDKFIKVYNDLLENREKHIKRVEEGKTYPKTI